MEQKQLKISYYESLHYVHLPEGDRQLFAKAIEYMKTAYAPYSKFPVGAAVLLANGEVVQGNNQENIAYPSGLCAERVAIFSAAARYPGVQIQAIAIVANPKEPGATVSPCGACRQVIMEYQRLLRHPIRIITGAINGPVMVIEDARALLPLAFFDPGLQNSES